MNYFPSLITIMVTLFILMIAGYVCRRRGIIDSAASKHLSRLIISVGQPMMIISALNRVEFTPENLTIAWQVTLISFVMHTLLALLAFFLCKLYKNKNEAKIFEFGLVFANCGFIGFPILDSILGDGIGSFMGAFYVISFHLFIWTWGLLILGRGRDDIKLTPKKILFNYGTVPCTIGVLLFFLKPLLPVPAWLAPVWFDGAIGRFLDYLGGLCTPISVLITGSLLATVSLRKTFCNPRLYLHSFFKLILLPVIACILAKLCGLPDTYLMLCTAMAAMPGAATITMLAELYDIEPGLASETVGVTSLLATGTLPLMMLFAGFVSGL